MSELKLHLGQSIQIVHLTEVLWLHLSYIRGDLAMTVLEGGPKSTRCSCYFEVGFPRRFGRTRRSKNHMLLLIQLVTLVRAFDAKIGREFSGRLVAAKGTAR